MSSDMMEHSVTSHDMETKMSNELVRSAQKHLVSTSDTTLRKEAGKALVKTGVGGAGLWVLAGALPFITLPMLLVLAVVFGGYLWAK